MVGTNVAFKATVVVSLQNFQNAGVAIAIPVRSLGKVAVFEVLDVADVGESNAVAMLANDICHIIIGISTKEPEQSVRQLQG